MPILEPKEVHLYLQTISKRNTPDVLKAMNNKWKSGYEKVQLLQEAKIKLATLKMLCRMTLTLVLVQQVRVKPI